jgi:Peptidase family C25
MDGLSSGKFIVNYSGHGSSGLWGSGTFFSVLHPAQLTNVNRQSIFTMLTCDNGAFTNPRNDSLAEAVLKADGGGVATWASTTATTPDYQLLLATPLYQHIGVGDIRRMGDLITNAKSSLAGSDVGYSWSLLGDPALQVRP